MHLDERKDVLLGQLVWVLGLLGVMHTDAVPPLPEEPAIVADAARRRGERSEGYTWVAQDQEPTSPPLATVILTLSVEGLLSGNQKVLSRHQLLLCRPEPALPTDSWCLLHPTEL